MDCPPGLEYLALIDQLIIKQKVCVHSIAISSSTCHCLAALDVTILNQIEALEAIAGVMGVGFETQNKYKIKNSLGQVPSSFICRQLDPVFERKNNTLQLSNDFKLSESVHLECVQSQGGLRVLHSYVVRTKSAF